jgi:hypothetical protein
MSPNKIKKNIIARISLDFSNGFILKRLKLLRLHRRNYAKTNKSMIENGIDKFEAIFEKCEHKIKHDKIL